MNLHQRARDCSFGLTPIALCAVALFYFVGCSTTKPAAETQVTAQQQKTQATTKRLTSAPASPSSSLDQLREGRPVGTASSSPVKDIYFDFDRYDLRPDARDTLKTDAEWLKQNPTVTVQIEGHCDER